ncbi:uncharacterized protein LOC129572859 [Sitodiplosis mosellana]|uniref:uncharacterized protein LOC129572859 n=1 Tax=Sitodiplosis mosellana TaxID=263140 RepID=UPI0024440C87|nr:uncharacterized protein LOC129572859 [Sitodiplosis mosellana]
MSQNRFVLKATDQNNLEKISKSTENLKNNIILMSLTNAQTDKVLKLAQDVFDTYSEAIENVIPSTEKNVRQNINTLHCRVKEILAAHDSAYKRKKKIGEKRERLCVCLNEGRGTERAKYIYATDMSPANRRGRFKSSQLLRIYKEYKFKYFNYFFLANTIFSWISQYLDRFSNKNSKVNYLYTYFCVCMQIWSIKCAYLQLSFLLATNETKQQKKTTTITLRNAVQMPVNICQYVSMNDTYYAETAGYYNYLTTERNLELLAFLTDILRIFQRCHKKLQSNDLTIASLVRPLNLLRNALEDLKQNPLLGGWKKALNEEIVVGEDEKVFLKEVELAQKETIWNYHQFFCDTKSLCN